MTDKLTVRIILPVLTAALAGCGAPSYEFDNKWHISKERVAQETPNAPEGVPDLVSSTAAMPELAYEGSSDVFDVVVENVNLRVVLNNLADQSKVNMDIDPFVNGVISMNAYGQTLDQILARIRAQVPLRFEWVGSSLVIMQDENYFKQYHVNYPGLTRTYSSSSSTGLSNDAGDVGSASVATSKDGTGSFWLDLEAAITDVLEVRNDLARALPSSDGPNDRARELAVFEAQPAVDEGFVHTMQDSGLIIVYTSSKLHEIISGIIAQVSSASKRQVLLEATVVEIQLSNRYKQGVDWSLFNYKNFDPETLTSGGFNPQIIQSATGSGQPVLNVTADGKVQAAAGGGGFISAVFQKGSLQAALNFLETFGDTKVVSSPRLSTLNGQAALLKVVRNEVFFTNQISLTPEIFTPSTGQAADDQGETDAAAEVPKQQFGVSRTETLTAQQVPIGFSMNVYPQISADGSIILTVRPSVTRLVRIATQTTSLGSVFQAPVVSVKEIESIIMINDGATAVLGGLIEDRQRDTDTQAPGLGKLPGLGNLFKNTDQNTERYEYVIFVSARIINNPSLQGDYSDFKRLLPSDELLRRDSSDSFTPESNVISVPRNR